MTLTNCPACQRELAPTDKNCPACGLALAGSSGLSKRTWIVIALIVAAVGGSCLLGIALVFVLPTMSAFKAARRAAESAEAEPTETVSAPEFLDAAAFEKLSDDLVRLLAACRTYAAQHKGTYPASPADLLVPGPDGRAAWTEGELPLDPWQRPYQFSFPEPGSGPFVYSLGPDGEADTEDDLGSVDADDEDRTRADMSQVASALYEFAIRNGGNYPTELRALWTPDSEGASYLDASTPPHDAWQNAYVYRPPAEGQSEFTLFSMGPDGVEGSADDIGLDD